MKNASNLQSQDVAQVGGVGSCQLGEVGGGGGGGPKELQVAKDQFAL